MSTRRSQRNMSRAEREDRALLGGGVPQSRSRQFEETVWGRVLLVTGVLLFLANGFWTAWEGLRNYQAHKADEWTLAFDAVKSLAQIIVACHMMIRLLRWLRPQTRISSDRNSTAA